MVTLLSTATDTPAARELLSEYFDLRAAIFPDGGYVTVHPDPSAFTRPAGDFLIARIEPADERDPRDAPLVTGDPVGCGGVRRIRDGAHGPRFEVKHLFLRPAARGRGWGHILLNGLEGRARELGATELVLDTHHTLTAAGALYARSGFTETEPYNDNPNATRWYRKQLAN